MLIFLTATIFHLQQGLQVIIEDYVYTENGDLDEFNGKFIINQDFPNGNYAYFSTINLSLIHI